MTYTFIAAFIGNDCCPDPHLWQETVRAATLKQARNKFIRNVSRHGTIYEMMQLTGPEVYPIQEVT